MNTYFFATVACGLEVVLADEIEELGIKARGIKCERGKVIFQATGNTSQLMKLRCADNIYRILAELRIGPHKSDLTQLAAAIDKLNWKRLASQYSDSSSGICASASRRGEHAYSRFNMIKTIEKVLEKHGFNHAKKEGADALFIRADIDGESCRISIKLTDAEFRFRGNDRIFLKGGIRPTVAAALVRISKPCKNDVFYDPFCGSGTIPNERAAFPARRILASDMEENAVWTAGKNGKGRVIVFYADATKMPSKSASVDIILCNPPWNKQIAVGDVKKLYIRFLSEAKRILKPSGRIVLLTDCHEEIARGAEKNGLQLNEMYSLSLHGLHPKVYELTIT
jgi:23S rRNA G2445 N2-methylase RlmL